MNDYNIIVLYLVLRKSRNSNENIWGKMENLNYINIPSIYSVILNDAKEKVLTVRNGKGHYFLPGGGLEKNESH